MPKPFKKAPVLGDTGINRGQGQPVMSSEFGDTTDATYSGVDMRDVGGFTGVGKMPPKDKEKRPKGARVKDYNTGMVKSYAKVKEAY